ncbi:MAG: hypothetical protein GY909_00210 [Oligoflexia bacterium]|nr:hypothetical protein [Oligoflexia bacterium]
MPKIALPILALFLLSITVVKFENELVFNEDDAKLYGFISKISFLSSYKINEDISFLNSILKFYNENLYKLDSEIIKFTKDPDKKISFSDQIEKHFKSNKMDHAGIFNSRKSTYKGHFINIKWLDQTGDTYFLEINKYRNINDLDSKETKKFFTTLRQIIRKIKTLVIVNDSSGGSIFTMNTIIGAFYDNEIDHFNYTKDFQLPVKEISHFRSDKTQILLRNLNTKTKSNIYKISEIPDKEPFLHSVFMNDSKKINKDVINKDLKVVLISTKNCMSSCKIFNLFLKKNYNVTHIGEESESIVRYSGPGLIYLRNSDLFVKLPTSKLFYDEEYLEFIKSGKKPKVINIKKPVQKIHKIINEEFETFSDSNPKRIIKRMNEILL